MTDCGHSKNNFILMRIWLLTGILFLISFNGYSQSINELREKKEDALKEIEYTTHLLNEVEKNRKSYLSQLKLLNNQIEKTNELISSITNELLVYEECISNNELAINMLQNALNRIKDEYAKMIRAAYRNKDSNDQLLFLLSADNFDQAYKRYLYLKDYAKYRRSQASIMQSLEAVLKEKAIDLEHQNQIKQNLIIETTQEKDKLLTAKEQQNTQLQKLQKEKSNLQQKLTEQQKVEKELENEIQRIIDEETRKNDDWK